MSKESSKATGAHNGSYFERQKKKGMRKGENKVERENKRKGMEVGEEEPQIWNEVPF